MAIKTTGISRDLIIHPGETLKDILADRNISQSELAKRTGISAAYINNVISGKKGISSNFAQALEYALRVPSSFWLNLQANYDAELLDYNKMNSITEEEKAVYYDLQVVVSFLRQNSLLPSTKDIKNTILSLRKIFGVSALNNLVNLVPQNAFRLPEASKTNPYVLGAWICLNKDIANYNGLNASVSSDKLPLLIQNLKQIILNGKNKL